MSPVGRNPGMSDNHIKNQLRDYIPTGPARLTEIPGQCNIPVNRAESFPVIAFTVPARTNKGQRATTWRPKNNNSKNLQYLHIKNRFKLENTLIRSNSRGGGAAQKVGEEGGRMLGVGMNGGGSRCV